MHRPSGIVVVTLLVVTGCAGPSGDSGELEVSSPVTTGPESGDLLLHGELTRNGEPAADGKVWVRVLADASNAEVGDTIPTWESALATSDDRGRFAVSVDEGELTRDFFNGDFLNFEINVVQDDDWAMWNTTAHLVGQGVWRTDEDSVVGDPVAEASFDLDASTLTLTDSDGQSETSDLPVVPDAGDAVLPYPGS